MQNMSSYACNVHRFLGRMANGDIQQAHAAFTD